MFTGIIEELGTVTAVEQHGDSVALTVRGPKVVADAQHGDSIATSGVCLTVVEQTDETFTAFVMKQTLDMSAHGALAVGDRLNLERAASVGDRLGGHIVQGHVDGLGEVRSVLPEGDGARVVVAASPEILRYCVEKGSITVDGVSLTVASVDGDSFAVALVPHTLSATTLGALAPGTAVNIEVDVLAKYVERLVAPGLR